ncbi:MAG TPA: hypothetical protein VJX16_15205 [Terriglobales bacterium]|nr:hypothetical protein [Terriglobales bacterium]
MKIRQLQPGAAWNDAERRSIPVDIVGFFLTGLLSSTGFLRAVLHAFTAGVLGAAAFFLATIAFWRNGQQGSHLRKPEFSKADGQWRRIRL